MARGWRLIGRSDSFISFGRHFRLKMVTNHKRLVAPGLATNEVAVYLALLKIGKPTMVRPIVRVSKLPPTTVRDNLASLLRKRLISRRMNRIGGVFSVLSRATVLKYCDHHLGALTAGFKDFSAIVKHTRPAS